MRKKQVQNHWISGIVLIGPILPEDSIPMDMKETGGINAHGVIGQILPVPTR